MSRLASAFALASVVTTSVLLAPTFAHAHARLLTPVRRVMADNNGGIKEAAKPCGGAKPATPANTYAPGQTIMLEIEETIQHPGHYELYWSDANDANLTVITGMNNIANPAGLQNTKVSFTMPNKTCDNCTLQLIMVMTEDPANPTNYYSCADIRLSNTPAMDMAGLSGDMADSAGADMATSGGTDDLGVTDPGDMTMRPPAGDVGLPGCSVAGNGAPFTLLSIFVALAMIGAPRLQLARRRRR